MKKYIFYSFAILVFVSNIAKAQQPSYIDLLKQEPKWVDSVFKKLSKRQKIAQMFFVRAHTNFIKAYMDSVGKVIKK